MTTPTTLYLTEREKNIIMCALAAVSKSGGGSETHSLLMALQEPFGILCETLNDQQIVAMQKIAAREILEVVVGDPI